VALSGSNCHHGCECFPRPVWPLAAIAQHGQSRFVRSRSPTPAKELERYQRRLLRRECQRLYPIQHLRQFGGGGAKCTSTSRQTSRGGNSHRSRCPSLTQAVDSPQTVALSGTGDAPVASVSPLACLWGINRRCHQLGSVGDLTNSGNAVLTVSRIAVSGTNASDFAQTNNCGTSVAAGAKLHISVTFKPSAGGSRSAVLAITDNAAGSPQSVSLSATGVSTGSMFPRQRGVWNQSVGATSSAHAVTLTNAGSSALSITASQSLASMPVTLPQSNNWGRASRQAPIARSTSRSKPTAAGSRSAAVAITDNATGSPQSASLSGTGVSIGGHCFPLQCGIWESIGRRRQLGLRLLPSPTPATRP